MENLYKLSNDSIGVSKKFTQRALSDIKNNKNMVFYTIVDNGEIVGMVGIDDNEMKYLAVHPEYRGQGIGTELMKTIFENHSNIVFNCNAKNVRALTFYNKFDEISETHRTTRKIFGNEFTLVYYSVNQQPKKRLRRSNRLKNNTKMVQG